MPAVSIIVPCYNGGRFLPGLLAALEALEFRDFETIIVDDGSTDPATIAFLDAAPGWVKVVRQANKGLPGARNTGFSHASADLVLPLDSDDTIAPDYLTKALAIYADADVRLGFVFSDMLLNGAMEGVLVRRANLFDQLFLNQLPCCMLIRKAAWAEVGGYDEAMRAGYEDWEFNIRLMKAGWCGQRMPEPLFNYRVAPDGMLMSTSARKHGRIWRSIRQKHAELYALPALRRIRAEAGPGKIGWPVALGLLAAGRLLPDAAFGRLFHVMLNGVHRLRQLTGRVKAGADLSGNRT